MKLSVEYLQALAAESGFRPETLEKVIRLGEYVADVGRHPLLSRVLALKGGTALNLAFGSPARLSVDLDFNYIGHVDRVRMQDERPQVERAVEIIGRGQGYQIQWSRDAHAGRKMHLTRVQPARVTGSRWTSTSCFARRSARYRSAPCGSRRRSPARKSPSCRQRSCSPESCAQPSTAACRAICSIPSACPTMPATCGGHCTCVASHVAMAGTLMHPLYDYRRERFDRVTDRSIQEQLSPMLHADEQPTAAGLKEAAWKIAAPLVELDDAEREYIERVHSGELRPELLFPDDAALVEQLTQHPALRWKIENVKQHRSR